MHFPFCEGQDHFQEGTEDLLKTSKRKKWNPGYCWSLMPLIPTYRALKSIFWNQGIWSLQGWLSGGKIQEQMLASVTCRV